MRVRKVVFFAVALVTATLLGPVPEVHAAGLTQGAVNFQAQGVPTPSGYVADWGLGFDSTRGFGWIQPTSSEPLSLLGKGRDRNRTADQRYDTLMHMQHTPADLGRWEVAVPTGVYDVTVAVGDPQYFDSVHNLNVEGINAVSSFAPSAADPFRTVTVRVVVDDGRLTLDQNGGTNTKLNFVEYVEVPSGRAVVSVDPADGASDVPANASVTLGLSHPVSSASITPETVKILDPTGSQVPGIYNTDGAGALVGFTPSERLALGTTYSVRVTSDLRDVDGYRFAEFTSTFTTSTSPPPSTGIAFEKVPFDVVGGPTSVVLGPDGRLYASTAVGQILRWDLTTEGTPAGPAQTIDHWTYQRTITGLHFDPSSTATDLKLWVSHSFLGDQDVANFQGKISVLTGANLETVRDVITGLPRSTRDHMNNGIDFGPDGKLYIAQGSLSGYGAPDSYWGDRAETPLSASILVADVNTDPRFASPVDVNTDAGYDATAADAPVKVYASGTRNPFDLVWHTNGKLYAPVNESASGNAPAGPGGSPPALTGLPAMNDFLAQVKAGRYYGHPNPSRGEYTLRGGNPTSAIDPFEVPQYPVGVAPDPRWDAPALDLGSHRSPNGVDEYRAQAFDGALKGKLLVANFGNGDDLTAITLDSTGAATGVEQVAWGFNNPLDVTSNPTSGVAWVAEFGSQASGAGGKITLLRPISSAVVPMRRINFQNSSAPIPDGYQGDWGLPYDASRGYGWIEQNSNTPLNLDGNGRDRNRVSDQRLDTLLFMQYDGNPKWAKPIPGRWEVALPEGLYDITVSVGDAQVFDGLHRMSAEGVTLIGGFTPTASTPFATGRARVRVSDGKLTLSAAGGTNTRINYVDIDRIEALRKVNFQDELAPTPSGYLRDFGLPYDTSRGYGWIAQDSNTPISLVGNGRDRNLVTDQRFDTFMHMQYPGGPPSGTTTPGRWEMAVAPGVYDITVAVGDPDTTILDSNHRVLVEGIAAIPFFTPDGVNQHQVATVRLNVVDGKVTLDAAGGTNTKIDYVEVNPAEGTVDAPEIDLVSPDDNLFLGTRLVFSTVKQEARPAKTLTVTNTGAGPLNVSNLSFVGPNAADYRLAAGQPTSFSVAPGDTQPVSVEFLPGAGGVERYASLVIASNDSDEATLDVPLRGLNAVDYEGNFEPSLQVITRTIGYGTTIGAESNYISNIRVPKGDEIISPYWKRVDPTKPVTLLPLAHYSGRNTSPVGYTGWHVKGTSTKNTLYAFPGGSDISGGENQRLLPNITPGGTTQFSTDSIFGIFVDNDWSDDGKNFPNKIHNFRFYPAKSPTGAVIPNAWLVGADIGSDASSTVKNYDYNDEAYLMVNVEPELQAAAMPGVNALDLPFTAPVPETVVDKDGEGTGFTGVQANNAGDQHQPALVDLDPSTGHLKITSTAGHNSGATNTQLNALEVGFDGTRKDHQTHVRLIGPFTNMTAATQFQGIYMGPDRDNFVKLEVEFRNGQTHLVLYQELAGTGSLPVTPIPIPAGASTVDLYLTGDLGGGRLTASYRVDSNDRSAIQPFGPAITLGDPLKWFSRQSRAGVVVANQGNTLPFTATMDDFWVKVFTTGYSSTAWTTRTPAPVQRLEAQGTAFEDKLYVFGGYTDTTFVPSTRLDIYDPVTNAWTSGAPLPIGTTHAGVAIVGREIWLAGGYIDNGSGGQIFATTNVWKYNFDTNTWAAGPPLPEARGSGGLVSLGGNVHFFGGGDTARADRGHHWMLPAGGSTWVSKAVLPNSRSHMGYVAFKGRVWAIGGQKGNDSSLVTQATVNSYDPVANTWTTMASLPGGRSHISGSTIVRDGLILMIGGETAHGSQISNVLAYDPSGNIWREQQRMPNARYSSVAGILGGDIYVATGSMKNTLFRGVPTAAAPTTPS